MKKTLLNIGFAGLMLTGLIIGTTSAWADCENTYYSECANKQVGVDNNGHPVYQYVCRLVEKPYCIHYPGEPN